MKTRTCYFDPHADIKLEQRGRNYFVVTYGLQVESGLTYSDAAKRLGCAIMHALACDGLLDNRERNER